MRSGPIAGEVHGLAARAPAFVTLEDATNLGSLFNMTRQVIEGMRARKFGRVINISSVNGQKGQFGQLSSRYGNATHSAYGYVMYGLVHCGLLNDMPRGHTHGGQLCLPGSIPIKLEAVLPRRMGAGAWQYHNMSSYTSVGAGSSVVPVRLNCPPEITLHCLRRG